MAIENLLRKTINLKSGGQITISVVTDPFNLTIKERQLIVSLITEISNYETNSVLLQNEPDNDNTKSNC